MPKLPSKLDPSLIDSAPIESVSQGEILDSERVIAALSAELEETKAELAGIKAKKTIDDVKVELLEPYSNKVFWFVVIYCLIVGLIIIGDGFRVFQFDLSDTVLGIIAGSTAVSVIGLIGVVVGGLFGSLKQK